MREITTVAAKCASCGQSFSHPSLSELSYGEVILSTVDGRHFVTADAFSEFSQRVAALSDKGSFWPTLASLADLVSGQPLTASIRCPHCGAGEIEYWGGDKTGAMLVPEATFDSSAALSRDSLVARIAAVTHGHEA